ncbi:MAG: DUF4190 domain-containing protein [Acidimicrobiales bacterium]|nr:DUF4190 domain-containing protein [Acidimicrobiales bacterium]
MASFVLSIVWIAGLGSLLAVIFGIIALVAISRAQGAQRGRGWAIAGLTIGAVGLLLTITLGVVVSRALVAQTYRYGTTVSTDASVTGFTSVTVFGIAPGLPVRSLTSGSVDDTYTVADVQVCVGPAGMPNVEEHLILFLLRIDGSVPIPSEPNLTARSPALWHSGVTWPPNQCQRGFLSFLVPPGQTPTGVRYQGNLLHAIQWTASGT